MSTVTVAPDLYKRIEKAAQEYQISADTLISEATRRYLWKLKRQKISEESQAYREQHKQLRAQYLGRYIAMRNGQVVDDDDDFQALRQRVRRKFGDTAVMITLVQENPETTLTRRGFRLGGNPE